MIKAFLATLLIVGASADLPTEDGVYILGDDNLHGAIKDHDMLVEFYAPWCGHCKKLEPEYKKAAAALGGDGKLAKVDATIHKQVAEEFGIRGFPTLKYFKGGKAIEYNGGRTAAEIVSWVKKQSGPPAKTINAKEDLIALQEQNEVVVVGFFSDVTSEHAKEFLAAANGDDVNSYAISSNDAIKSHLGLQGDGVVLLKSFDEGRNDFTGSIDKAEVKKFVDAKSIPLVQTFSQEASKKIFGSPVQKHVLFFTNNKADHHNGVMDAFKTVATQFQGQVLVVNVPHTETRVTEYFGITDADLPKFVLADMSSKSMKKYPYNGDMTSPNAIAAHIQSFLNGDLKPSLKSEAVLPEDTAGDVVVLKGTSFNDIVLNNNKDVLVEFYAPWCGHCKKLAPTWDELGATFKDNENIVIAKMDATANEVDVEGMAVSGFPTIYFFPGENKRPVKYESGRELEDFIHYLMDHGTHKFEHKHEEL